MTGEVLTAAAVVAGERVLRPGWLTVANGVVTGAGPGTPQELVHTDLGDVVVVPGFVDVHVHGGGGGSFTSADPAGVGRAAAFHQGRGTTTLLASLVTAPSPALASAVAVLADLADAGAIAGIHLEGPWLSARRCGAHAVAYLRDPDPAEIDHLLAAGRGWVRMVTLAPERSGGLEAIRRIVQAGAVAAVGHTDAPYATTRAAVAAGATVATHLFNAMRPLHHREPGPVAALLEDPRVTLEMVLDGVHLHPAVYRQVLAAAGASRVALVSDAMAAAGLGDGTYRLGELTVAVRDGQARVDGSDTLAGSTATAADLFRRALAEGWEAGDAALLAAVRQTSAVPARALGFGEHRLAAGNPADLVVLDAEHRVRAVMKGGAWLPQADPAIVAEP